jgi:hypothetical protein
LYCAGLAGTFRLRKHAAGNAQAVPVDCCFSSPLTTIDLLLLHKHAGAYKAVLNTAYVHNIHVHRNVHVYWVLHSWGQGVHTQWCLKMVFENNVFDNVHGILAGCTSGAVSPALLQSVFILQCFYVDAGSSNPVGLARLVIVRHLNATDRMQQQTRC